MEIRLERKWQPQVIKELERLGAYVIKYDGARAGVPDLLVCHKGKFFGIELKVKSRMSKIQEYNLVLINKAGGVGVMFRYSKDWKNVLKGLLDNG